MLHALQVPVQEFSQQMPSTQLPFRHSELAPQEMPSSFLHALLPVPVPLQAFVPVQLGASSRPFGTVVQVPRLPVRLQAWHVIPQAALQQTVSTHIVLAHSLLAAQFFPFDFLHWPVPLQISPPFWLQVKPEASFG